MVSAQLIARNGGSAQLITRNGGSAQLITRNGGSAQLITHIAVHVHVEGNIFEKR